MRKYFKYIPLFLFVLFVIGYSVVNFLLPDIEFSENENRILAKNPKLSLSSLYNGDYTTNYESYFNDQFNGRSKWISAKSALEFGLGKSENNEIIYGNDDFQMEKILTLTSDQKGQLQRNTQYVASIKEKLPDVNVFFSIAPSSSAIFPEKLPSNIPTINQLSIIDELENDVQKKGIIPLSIADTLADKKDQYIYYRTDHHWTTLGAYYVYENIVNQLGYDAVNLDNLSPISIDNFYGTYYSKSNFFATAPDTLSYYDLPIKEMLINETSYTSMYDTEQFEQRDKYAGYLRSNNGVTRIRSLSYDPSGKNSQMLLIKDSYGNSIAPFFTSNFDEVIVVDLRYIASINDLISENEFDLVYILYSFSNYSQDTNLVKLAQ